jgi:hypothetical protein
VVKTSFSLAFAHIGRCSSRQKDFLHAEQVLDTARAEDWWVERGMMVLLVKQVHLQNEGGAGGFLAMCMGVELESLHAARTVNMRVKIRKSTDNRAISSNNS